MCVFLYMTTGKLVACRGNQLHTNIKEASINSRRMNAGWRPHIQALLRSKISDREVKGLQGFVGKESLPKLVAVLRHNFKNYTSWSCTHASKVVTFAITVVIVSLVYSQGHLVGTNLIQESRYFLVSSSLDFSWSSISKACQPRNWEHWLAIHWLSFQSFVMEIRVSRLTLLVL